MFSGDRLSELRKDKGLGQKELAAILDISEQRLARYERGFSKPDIIVLENIANYFNVSMDYLMGYGDMDIPLKSKIVITLPKSFTPESVKKVKEYIKLLSLGEKNDEK